MNSSKFDSRISDQIPIMDPETRLRNICEVGNSVDIDINIPPRRYFRSGVEMVRMANVYLDEGNLESAFVLYLRFMTLFLEKIRTHPDFIMVSVTDRAINSQKLREVLPKAEKLKSQLLDQYKREYECAMRDQRRRDAAVQPTSGLLEDRNKGSKKAPEPRIPSYAMPQCFITPVPPLPDDFVYPSDSFVEPTSSAQVSTSGARPGVDRSTKPGSLLGTCRLGRRPLIVPAPLMQRFLLLSQRNTDRNIETCGILAGRLNHDQLVITHLLVPKQNGTPDSCATQCEEEIFDYQDQHDLITFGWIHTHPTQTAFLSSVDLHTHCSYQLMMPEAIAIVCAPRYLENSFFCLTPNYGLDFIASCRQTGFHPHPTDPPLFMVAEHCRLDSSANVEIVDLRR